MSEETYSTEGLICPHCQHLDRYTWELEDGECGTVECLSCGVEFDYSCHVSTSYTGKAKK